MCVCIDDSSTSVSHVSNETINLVGHVSFNVGNIGTGKVYLCPMRTGSSYLELMAGLGYTVLCSGDCTVWWWICDGLGRYL